MTLKEHYAMQDNILELWKRLHRIGRYYDKPIRYTEFADQIQELVEQQVLIDRKAELQDAQNAWVKHGKIEQDVDYFVDRTTELDHQIQLLKEGK